MADDRRIITGTHVVVKEGNITEDATAPHKYIMKVSPGKPLGGKSIVTDVANTQNFAGGDAWYQGDNKATALSVAGVTKPTGVTTDTDNLQFLYVRNLDATLDCYVSLTTASIWNTGWANTTAGDWESGGTGDYAKKAPAYDGRWDEGMYIVVPPGGSVQLRGDSIPNTQMNHVRFRSSNGTTAINIEYVLAE